MTRPFGFDRTWFLPAPPGEVWDILGRTDEYPTWWSWLSEFDTPGLRRGATARCRIQAPLPYSLRCTIHVDEMDAPHSIVTTVAGDLRGPARLELRADGAGSAARLEWSVVLADPVLAALSRVARPAMAWAHDQVVAAGVEQFVRRALPATG